MPRKLALLSALAVACLASPAVASSDYLLQIPSTRGEASVPVAVASWSFGVCNSGQCTASQASAKAGTGKGSWDLATGKGARTAPGGVRVATGDVDGDGAPDLVFAASQDVVYGLQFTVDANAPGVAAMCASGRLDGGTLNNGADSFAVSSASVVCTKGSGAAAASYARSGINRIDSTPARISTNLTTGKQSSSSACSSGSCDALTDGLLIVRFADGQMKHTKSGHVTLLK